MAVSYTHLDVYKRQIQSGGVLGSSGLPLADACDLTGDPLVGLVGSGIGVRGVVGLQVHHDVAIHQALDEVDALSNLVLGVVQEMCIRDRQTASSACPFP